MRPQDLLLLQVGSSYLRAAPTLFTDVGVHGRMRLLKPAGPDWIVPGTVVEPFTTTFFGAGRSRGRGQQLRSTISASIWSRPARCPRA